MATKVKRRCGWSMTDESDGVLIPCRCTKRRNHLGRHRFEQIYTVTAPRPVLNHQFISAPGAAATAPGADATSPDSPEAR